MQQELAIAWGGKPPILFALGLAMVLLAGPSAANADNSAGEHRALWQAAEANLGVLDKQYAAGLAPLLGSKNPYERQASLNRFLASPALFPQAALPVLVALVEDAEVTFPADCVQLLAREAKPRSRGPMGQGEYAEVGACRRYQGFPVSRDATKLLDVVVRHFPSEYVVKTITERLKVSPASASHLAPIMPRLGQAVPPELALALADATTAKMRHALLTLMMGFPPYTYPPPELMPTLDALVQSSHEEVQHKAAVVVLIVTWERREMALSNSKAVDVLSAGLRDAQRQGLAADVVKAGRAAKPLLPSLTARLSEQNLLDAPAVLRAIGAIGADARGATSAIVAHLGTRSTSLGDAVSALVAIDARLKSQQKKILARAYQKECREADAFVKQMQQGFADEHPAMDDVWANYPEACRLAQDGMRKLKAM